MIGQRQHAKTCSPAAATQQVCKSNVSLEQTFRHTGTSTASIKDTVVSPLVHDNRGSPSVHHTRVLHHHHRVSFIASYLRPPPGVELIEHHANGTWRYSPPSPSTAPSLQPATASTFRAPTDSPTKFPPPQNISSTSYASGPKASRDN